jgi:hypothetical protein
VRLYKPGDDLDVCIHETPIQKDRRSLRRLTQTHMCGIVPGVMILNVYRIANAAIIDNGPFLAFRRRPM